MWTQKMILDAKLKKLLDPDKILKMHSEAIRLKFDPI